jgi:hypothetical protein
VLLTLALLNLLRSVVPLGSLIGPLLLVGIALGGLVLTRGITTRTVQDLVIPAALALVGVALLLSVSRNLSTSRWTRFLSTGRVVAPGKATELLTLRAIAGELRADLTAVRHDSSTTVHITAIAGHVHLVVPRTCRVRVHSTGALLSRITQLGPETLTSEPYEIVLHVLGVCGAVSIVRA